MDSDSQLLLHVANSTSLYLLIDIQSLLQFPSLFFPSLPFLPSLFFPSFCFLSYFLSFLLILFYFLPFSFFLLPSLCLCSSSSPLSSFSFLFFSFLFFYIHTDVLSPSNSHPLLQSPSSFHLSLISLNSNPFFPSLLLSRLHG